MKNNVVVVGILLAACMASSGWADLTNRSFETGDLSGWTIASNAGSGWSVNVVDTHTSAGVAPMSWSPEHGSWFALLTPSANGTQKTVQLYQSFVVSSADEVLSFDYFWDSEPGSPAGPQTARGLILSGTGAILPSGLLSGTQVGSNLFSLTSADPDSAWTSFSGDVVTLGLTPGETYTLVFENMGRYNVADRSHLGVDDVKLRDPDLPPVPVPGAWLLGMLGFGAAGVRLRRVA